MKSIQTVEKIRKFNRFYANVLGKIDQEIYNQPYPLTEARVITEIHARNGCTATEVRETLGIDRGYMSRIVQRFETEGIICKKRSADDKRQYVLYLTAKGKDVYDQLVEDANREVGKMIETMTKNEQAQLITSMETIEAILSHEQRSHAEIVIRSFQPGDVGYVAYLHGRLYDKTYNFGSTFENYVMKGLTEFIENSEGGDIWVAEINGKIVGSIAITKFSESIAQLRWFVVDENHQGMGIGNRLMETALAFCQTRAYKHVFLWTVNILDAARHLYQKYNFTLTEEKPNETWTGSTLIEERWDLSLKSH